MAGSRPLPRTVLLAGASGLIGRELVTRLLASEHCGRLHVLARRAVPGLPHHAKLAVHLVDFAHLPQPLPACDDVYIALGTTIKVAGSQAAFRKVDFEAVVATARAARTAGATRLAVVSALGADRRSRVFYNRVKGEMQDAVSGLGYTTVTFAQPSLLSGDRAALGQPTRAGEVWTLRLLAPVLGWVPQRIRPIAAADVANALIEATWRASPGVHILASGDMQGAAAK
jgi:uncharacterized protein YbjT (DUF2867 family)